jgi:DNA-binding GntR family transcriptional regulator
VRPIDTPKYQQIADQLRRRIIDGVYAPAATFPSQADLVREFGVSSRVIVDATKLLASEGLIDTKPGALSTVRDRPAAVRMVRSWYLEQRDGSPWRADMAAQGRTGAWEAQSERTSAPPAIAERLHIQPGDRVMRTDYVFTADGHPTYLSTSWEPLALTRGTDIMLPEAGPYEGRGVAERMAAIGHPPTRVDEEILPRTLTLPEAGQLKLRPGIAIVVIQRTYYDGELPLETADIVIPPPYRPLYQIPIG